MELKVGFIGCGRIVEMHTNAVRRLPNVKVVAVCDIDAEKANSVAESFECTSYTDYETMLDNEELDIVHLCLPHYLHSIVGSYAANKKIHVLTEKPLDISVERAQMLIDDCDRNDVKLGVIFQNRYRTTNRQMYDMIQSGDFGKILGAKMYLSWERTEQYYIDTPWKGKWATEGGGVVIDQAIHTIDFINWVLGGDFTSVDAFIANRYHPSIEVEDIAEGSIQYRDGYRFSFHALNYYSYDAEVYAEVQTELATFKMTGSMLEIESVNGEIIRNDISTQEVLSNQVSDKVYWGTTHYDQILEFYDFVRGTRDSIGVDGREALKTQKLVEAIYQSGKINNKNI